MDSSKTTTSLALGVAILVSVLHGGAAARADRLAAEAAWSFNTKG